MELIRIEEVNYDWDNNITPTKGEMYINKEHLLYVEKRAKNTSDENAGFIYVTRLTGGYEIHITEECYNSILRYNGVWEKGMGLPPVPEIEPTKPDYW